MFKTIIFFISEYNSWEPEENITEDLIEAFNSSQKQDKQNEEKCDSGLYNAFV